MKYYYQISKLQYLSQTIYNTNQSNRLSSSSIKIQINKMQSLLLSKKPIMLKPSPPASSHLLSYNTFVSQRLKQQYNLSKNDQFLKQLQHLSSIIHQQEQIIKQAKQQHMKQILQFSIELEHQIRVTGSYTSQLRKCQSSRNQLKNYYEMKLEIIKKQLAQAFQVQIKTEKERTLEDLKQIRQNYCSKIALIAQGNRDKQFQFAEKDQKVGNYELKLSLLQSKLNQRERLLSKQTQQLAIFQSQKQQYEILIRNLTDEANEKINDNKRNLQSYKLKYEQAQHLKQQLHKQLISMKNYEQNQQQQRQSLLKNNTILKDELQLALRKFNCIQKELNDLNRKTFKKQEQYDQGKRLESGRQTERDRQRQKSKDRQRDKQTIIKLTEQKGKIAEQKDKLIEQRNSLIGLIKQKQKQIQTLNKNYEGMKAQQQSAIFEPEKTQVLHLKKQNNELQQQLSKIKDQIRDVKQLLSKKNDQIQQLQQQIKTQSQQFTKKMDFFIQKSEQVQQTWQQQQNQLKQLQKKITGQYLKQIQDLHKKIEGLEITLNQTHQLLERQVKQKKAINDELQTLQKKKGKN